MATALWPIYRLLDLVVVKILAGADVPAGCHLGSNVVLPHGAKGVVISDTAVVGDRVTIYHQVTLPEGVAIGHDVWIAPGAKFAAHVTVGHFSKIAPNSFVDKDVPEGSIATGVPATTRRRSSFPDNT